MLLIQELKRAHNKSSSSKNNNNNNNNNTEGNDNYTSSSAAPQPLPRQESFQMSNGPPNIGPGKYSKRRRSYVAVTIVRIVLLVYSSFVIFS